MWYVCDVPYAVLCVYVRCFVVHGCSVSRRYIDVCNCDMFSVVYINGRRYACCGECYVVPNEGDEPTLTLCNISVRTVVKLCTLGVFTLRVSLVS